MKQSLRELTTTKQQVANLSERMDDAYKIIHQQQLVLEVLDNKDRKLNLILTGVSESADELGSTDEEKISKVIEATARRMGGWVTRWLGKINKRNMRPIHITVNNQIQRDSIVLTGKNLKNANQTLSIVYIKKDVHPAVRRDNTRLRKREREEKGKPEYVGVNIEYDWKNRVLLRNGAAIDSPAQYGALARHTSDQDKVIVLGDFNARVATPLLADRDGNYYQYQGVQDNVVNEHGRTLLNICNNNGLTVAG
ncbi:hypothetical protein Pcinc_023756 [Petrolisthes cinctipes]|uniref:Endonuclease/exonuclease/phosphatase domain-containing protein n=1 Tax=Petrolisthes cinctipes TaxID=88211 RepID=A0AAE1FBD1_PETCI|nr:hypothetical protein Pcinc_023756 [Petrolisthes cinctipes]